MMADTGFKRVSKKYPCRVCGKPDWCSTSATETISFCARSTLNADRVSRHGWGVYYQDEYRYCFDLKQNYKRFPKARKKTVAEPLAPVAIRDRIYRKLIELSPATSNNVIVNGRGGLSERGILDYSRYGSLPRLVNERQVLVDRLVETLAENGIRSFDGIPGFWRDANGGLRLWSDTDSFDDMMLIPFVGPDALTRACQVRFMRYIPNKSGRYVWLSSAKQKSGCGPGAPLHHAAPASCVGKPVLITEGALKAATAQRFLPDRYVVGNSGVATSHREIIVTARRKTLEIGFDDDSFTNPHVTRALASLIRRRLDDQRTFGYSDDVWILTWGKSLKGIDDALLNNVSIVRMSPEEWFKHLTPECADQARSLPIYLEGTTRTGIFA